MSDQRRKLSTVRRPSTLLQVPSSTSTQQSASRPSSPSILSCASRRIRDLYDGTFHDTTPEFDMLNSHSKPAATSKSTKPPPRPPITEPAKSFANAVSASQLSDLLIWFLYYDVVDLPDTPKAWYAPIKTTDMRGWVALGAFLSQSQAFGEGYGLDLVVLDSICDRLRLHKSLVHEILIKFSTPQKMKYGVLATTVKRVEEKQMDPLPKYIEFEAKLNGMQQLAARLEPTPGSQYVTWQADIQERISGLLHLYIGPRIANAKDGTPLFENATNRNLPKEARLGLELAFLFQAVQLERKVPLARYNELDDEEPALSEHGPVAESLLERECQGDLLQENIDLKEQRKRMAKAMGDLEAHNERLEAKLKIAVSVWETFTGEKMAYADSPSSVYDETSPSSTPTLPNHQAGYAGDAENEALPTIRMSWPSDSDVQVARSSGSLMPDRLDRRPGRRMSYLNVVHSEQARHRRSGFVGAERLQGLGIGGIDAAMQGEVPAQQEDRQERSMFREQAVTLTLPRCKAGD